MADNDCLCHILCLHHGHVLATELSESALAISASNLGSAVSVVKKPSSVTLRKGS